MKDMQDEYDDAVERAESALSQPYKVYGGDLGRALAGLTWAVLAVAAAVKCVGTKK